MATSLDSFKSRRTLTVGSASYDYYSLPDAEKNGLAGISRLPFSLKVLLENLLRHEDGRTVTADDIRAMAAWLADRAGATARSPSGPARVLMQDFTGVPAVVDLAAMRDAMVALGGDPASINPLVPVDLVIDHSVMVDAFGNAHGLRRTMSSANTSATASATSSCAGASPPSTISASCRRAPASATRSTSNISPRPCGPARTDGAHRRLSRHAGRHRQPHHHGQRPRRARLGRRRHRGRGRHARPADLHAHPRGRRLPLTGRLPEGVTATDLVLTVTQMLRKKGVVGKFVEFFGAGPLAPVAGGPGDHRQHGAGIRRHLRLLPGRQGHARLSQGDRPRRRPHRPGRGLRQGAGHVPRGRHARSGVHRHAGARSRHRRALDRRAEAPAGPRRALPCRHRLRGGARRHPRRQRRRPGLRHGRGRRRLGARALSLGQGRGQGLQARPTATWSSPPSPPAPTPPTRAC